MRNTRRALPWLTLITLCYGLALAAFGAVPALHSNVLDVAAFIGTWLALLLAAMLAAFFAKRPVLWGAITAGLLTIVASSGVLVEQRTHVSITPEPSSLLPLALEP